MREEQFAVFRFILRKIQLVLLDDRSVFIHHIINASGRPVFFHRSRHPADNQIEIEHLHDFPVNDFLYGRFGCKRLPQRIQYGLADMEDLQELFKIQRVHIERLQIADRCGFQIHDLHTQQ